MQCCGRNSDSIGVNAACELSTQVPHNLEYAAEHPDMTENLPELLSTTDITAEHRVVTGLEID